MACLGLMAYYKEVNPGNQIKVEQMREKDNSPEGWRGGRVTYIL